MNKQVEAPPDSIAQVIQDVHTLGEELGFAKVRVDRSARLDESGRELCYFEVGYGCREIKIRTYVAGGAPVGFLRFPTDRVEMDSVLMLLAALIDEAEGEVRL